MGFDTTDLLRQAGYSQGDVLPVVTYALTKGDELSSTTSSTFVNVSDVAEYSEVFDSYPVDSFQVRTLAELDANTDEAIFRWRNATDGETVGTTVSTTSSSFSRVDSGFVSYTPTTQASPVSIVGQLRNTDNAETVRVAYAAQQIGIQL